MKSKTVAAALSFAHLIGLGKRAEDEDDKKTKRAVDEQDEEQASRAESEDDEQEAARADEEDGDGDSDEDMQSENGDEDDQQEGDDKKNNKARKAKSKGHADQGDDDDEKNDAKSARSAIRRERARCAKIIAHGITTGRVRQAGVLAFDSNLSVKAAIATLDAGQADQPAARREGLAERMAATQVPTVGADGGSDTPAGVTKTAAAIIAIGEKVRAQK